MLLSILQSLYLSNGTRFVIASIFFDEVDFVNKSMYEVVDGNTAMCSGLSIDLQKYCFGDVVYLF